MRTDRDGRGMINILVADKLLQSPRLYCHLLLWMLSELFEELPESPATCRSRSSCSSSTRRTCYLMTRRRL